jgi:hypothetical protein
MKFDRQKTFPYPVLRPFSDDYLEVDFQTNSEFTITGNEISLDCTFITSSEELQTEIEKGFAKFVSIVSCRDTYFRKVIQTDKQTFSVKLDADSLRGEVLVDSYIVAVKDINGFRSQDINPEFGQDVFFFTAGQILAQDETNAIYIDRELFKPLSSVFELVKNEQLSGGKWKVGVDQDNVQIEVSPEMKESIDNARNSKTSRAVLINSLYFSSVTQAIQMLKDVGDFGDLKWARVMSQQIHNKGLDIKSQDAYVIAQELMKHPLNVLRANVFQGESNV